MLECKILFVISQSEGMMMMITVGYYNTMKSRLIMDKSFLCIHPQSTPSVSN